MNNSRLRLSSLAFCFSTLVFSSALLYGEVSAHGTQQVQGVHTGPVCTKCTAGPQSGTPMRSLLIHVMQNNHPVRNATVILSAPSGFTGTYKTDAAGAIHTEAPLGIYNLSAQKNTQSGSTEMEIPSGRGVIEVSIRLSEDSD